MQGHIFQFRKVCIMYAIRIFNCSKYFGTRSPSSRRQCVPVPKIFNGTDTFSGTTHFWYRYFFGTNFFQYRFWDFFRYQILPIPVPRLFLATFFSHTTKNEKFPVTVCHTLLGAIQILQTEKDGRPFFKESSLQGGLGILKGEDPLWWIHYYRMVQGVYPGWSSPWRAIMMKQK